MEAVALWVNKKPNKEFDLQMTGFQEVLFWYGCTIISLQFFINLIRRKCFRIPVSMNTGSPTRIFAEKKTKEFKNFLLKKQVSNCVHTSITRESAIISPSQVLFGEKCPDMNMGSKVSFKSCSKHVGKFYCEVASLILQDKLMLLCS